MNRLLSILVVLGIPFLLAFIFISFIVAWDYPKYEYAKENFPADRYGFTQADRLELATVAVGYLQEPGTPDETIYLLEEQRIPGTDDSLYNEREIEHMLDVKHLTDNIARAAWFLLVIVGGSWLLLWADPTRRPIAYQSLFYGGIGTMGLLLAIGLFVVLGWSLFFTTFHELLFPPGTWTFYYSDSLIRLFPEKFWFDLGVLMTSGIFVLGGVTAFVGRWLGRSS